MNTDNQTISLIENTIVRVKHSNELTQHAFGENREIINKIGLGETPRPSLKKLLTAGKKAVSRDGFRDF